MLPVGLVQKAHQESVDIDWKKAIPRWMLLGMFISSMGINTLLGTMVVGLIVERFRVIEKAQDDPKWRLVTELATVQAQHATLLAQAKDDSRTIQLVNARVLELQARFDVMNTRLMRKGL